MEEFLKQIAKSDEQIRDQVIDSDQTFFLIKNIQFVAKKVYNNILNLIDIFSIYNFEFKLNKSVFIV